MLYILIEKADSYIDKLQILINNPFVDTERLEIFQKQVLELKSWYKAHVDDLHENPTFDGKNSVSLYKIALRAHPSELAYQEEYPELYNEKYQELSGMVSRLISTYHYNIEALEQSLLSAQKDIEHLKLERELYKKQHKTQINTMIILAIAAVIGQWQFF